MAGILDALGIIAIGTTGGIVIGVVGLGFAVWGIGRMVDWW